ncbi:hypothetical protein F4810DRAFT_723205 [Camillea tinctor]|nr:hypothetical protein F4810DRAFT_723205 [Camillea tinctor]
MPYHIASAPVGIPEYETIESLLGLPNPSTKHTRGIKTLQELNDEEKRNFNLITLGKRCTAIPGDPYGLYPAWSGNVAHPKDRRIFQIMSPIFDLLMQNRISDNSSLSAIQTLLSKIPGADIISVAKELAENQVFTLLRDTNEETVVEFQMKSMSIRLMNTKDIDKDDRDPYNKTLRATESSKKSIEAFPEQPMVAQDQKHVMALIMKEGKGALNSPEINRGKGFFENLRSLAQEKFWLHMTKDERSKCRQEAKSAQADLEDYLRIVNANWSPSWNNGRYDVDYFYQYLKDQTAAEEVWELVDADIFVVTDAKNRVIFANIENLAQTMHSQSTVDTLVRALDMWSYFTPLPHPESRRHVLDRYVRRIHPELDPAKATVDRLPAAKMAVAHLGCWSETGDPNGEEVFLSADAAFTKSAAQKNCRRLFPQFCKAVLGKATQTIRLLVKNLDPEHYEECVKVIQQLPDEERIHTDPEDFLGLFALGVNGYTQRHRDTSDVKGGNLCIPQLGVKVPYRPGACAVIRGDKLEHLVTDYTPPRYFLIGTNHESVKRWAFRKMGMEPEAVEPPTTDHEDKIGFPLETPCINPGNDDQDDDEIEWTNKMLHGAAALDSGDSGSG